MCRNAARSYWNEAQGSCQDAGIGCGVTLHWEKDSWECEGMMQLLFLAQGPKEVEVTDSGQRDGDFAVALGWDFGFQQFEPRQKLMTGGRSK